MPKPRGELKPGLLLLLDLKRRIPAANQILPHMQCSSADGWGIACAHVRIRDCHVVSFKKMAKRLLNRFSSHRTSTKDILCRTCGERFMYRSKYTRHLLSTKHVQFAESLGITLQDQLLEEDFGASLSSDSATVLPHFDTGDVDQCGDDADQWDEDYFEVMAMLYEARNWARGSRFSTKHARNLTS